MVEELLELHKNSYVPISNFPVSSIIVMKDGTKFPGVNIEDASTRAGTCAERSAISGAISAGYKKGDFKEIHVMVSSGKIGTPCFVCRQLLLEFFDLEDNIYCYQTDGKYEVFKLKELCPHPFGEEDLK